MVDENDREEGEESLSPSNVGLAVEDLDLSIVTYSRSLFLK